MEEEEEKERGIQETFQNVIAEKDALIESLKAGLENQKDQLLYLTDQTEMLVGEKEPVPWS